MGGSGGVGGAGGSAGTGGTGSCPVQDANVLRIVSGWQPRDVVVSGQEVYFSDPTAGEIVHFQMPSGQPEVVGSAALYPASTEAFDGPDSLAIEGNYLYWRAQEGSSVWRMPLTGATPSLIASVTAAFPSGSTVGLHDVIAVDAGKVFWVEGPEPFGVSDTEFRVHEAPVEGGAATLRASFTSDENDLDKPYQPLSLDADATDLFFSVYGPTQSVLMRMSTDTGAAETFGPAGNHLTEAGTNVFSTSGSFVWRNAKDGSGITVVTTGLDPSEYHVIAQGIETTSTQVLTSYLGTTISSGMGCCSCGWIMASDQQDTGEDPMVLWSGHGRATAMSVDDGSFIAAVNLDDGEVLLLSP